MKKGTEIIFYNIDTGKLIYAEIIRKYKNFTKVLIGDKETKAYEKEEGWRVENYSDKIYEISIKGTEEQLKLEEKYRIKRKNINIRVLESEINLKKSKIDKKQKEIKTIEEEIQELKNKLSNIV